MARRLGSTPFRELLPDSLSGDPSIRAAAAALDTVLDATTRAIPGVLLYARLAHDTGFVEPVAMLPPLARLSELSGGLASLPEPVLDLLAWQLHVESYEAAVDVAAKRRLIAGSLLLHRRRGTPWAVSEALRVLGYADAKIIEGAGVCAHNGEVAHNGAETYASGNRWALFDVEIDLGEDQGISISSVQHLRSVVEDWKNVRSHLRSLRWRATVADDVKISEVSCTRVKSGMYDHAFWGFPLHDGTISYNNGLFRAHDGRLFHDGANQHTRWEPFGHLHDARLESLDVAVRPVMADAVRYVPLHDGALLYDGQGRHGTLEAPAVDALNTRLSARCREVLDVREDVETRLEVTALDEVGRYHDGSITHGQRYISLHNGAFFHDGSHGRGPFGGRADFSGVRHDGRARHDGQARHSLWGWLPKAGERAPVFTYATLSDVCAVAVSTAGMEDAFTLTEDVTVRVLRYTLHDGTAFHNSGPRYGGAVVASGSAAYE